MPLTLVYFAWVRERVGKPQETVDLPQDVRDVAGLIDWLRTRGEEYAHAFENGHLIRVAIDKVHARHDALVSGAREIAFFPPMTGG